MTWILGKGGFAREVASYLPDDENSWFFENEEINKLYNESEERINPVLIAIGDGKIRKKLVDLYPDFNYISLCIAPIFDGKKPSEGSIICPGTIITVNVKIGKFVVINLNCTVGHDSVIGEYTTISPGVNMSGNVKIGKLCYIGSNAVIREGISICDNVVIGAGSVVVKDIIEPGTYVGNPCKKIK